MVRFNFSVEVQCRLNSSVKVYLPAFVKLLVQSRWISSGKAIRTAFVQGHGLVGLLQKSLACSFRTTLYCCNNQIELFNLQESLGYCSCAVGLLGATLAEKS